MINAVKVSNETHALILVDLELQTPKCILSREAISELHGRYAS